MNFETKQTMQVGDKNLPLIHTADLVGYFREKYKHAEPTLRNIQMDLAALGEELVLFNETVTAHIDVTDPAVIFHMRESLVKSMQIVIALLPKKVLEPAVLYTNVLDNFSNGGMRGDSEYQEYHDAYRLILCDLLKHSVEKQMPWMIDAVETRSSGEALNAISGTTLFDVGSIYALVYNAGHYVHNTSTFFGAGFNIYKLSHIPSEINKSQGKLQSLPATSVPIPAIMDYIKQKGEK